MQNNFNLFFLIRFSGNEVVDIDLKLYFSEIEETVVPTESVKNENFWEGKFGDSLK